jgi:hypothetical protein
MAPELPFLYDDQSPYAKASGNRSPAVATIAVADIKRAVRHEESQRADGG